MGTRAFIIIKYNDKVYRFYNHCDGGYYRLGLNLINDLIEYFRQDSSLENMKMEVSKIILVNALSDKDPDEWSEYERETIMNKIKVEYDIAEEDLEMTSDEEINEAGYDVNCFKAVKTKNIKFLIKSEPSFLSGNEIYFGSCSLNTKAGGYKYIFKYLAKHNYIYDEGNSCSRADEYKYILDLDNFKFGFRNLYEKTGLDLKINEKNLQFIKELFESG